MEVKAATATLYTQDKFCWTRGYLGAFDTLEVCAAEVGVHLIWCNGDGLFSYNSNHGWCECCRNKDGVEDGTDLRDFSGSNIYKLDPPCEGITPKAVSPAKKIVYKTNVFIEPSELYNGLLDSNCPAALTMCKLEYRNTQGAATFSDYTTTTYVRDGITVASSGKVTLNHNTLYVPENEEFRLNCDGGVNISPTFTAMKAATATLVTPNK